MRNSYYWCVIILILSLVILENYGLPTYITDDELYKEAERLLNSENVEKISSSTKANEKRYFGLAPGFSYHGHEGEGSHGGGGGDHHGGGGGCSEHGHLDDVEPIHGHEGFHASQHPHHDDCHHDDGHHAPAYGHAGGSEHEDEGIEHSHHSDANGMMQHAGPGVHFHTGMIHMDEGGHISRGDSEEGNLFTGIDSSEPHHSHEDDHDDHDHDDGGEHHGGGGMGGGGSMMQIPIAPLPHGYHHGLGPNGEAEDHDDEELEEMEHEKAEREHEYDMDRGGPDEHKMLEHDAGHEGLHHLERMHTQRHGHGNPVEEDHHHPHHHHHHHPIHHHHKKPGQKPGGSFHHQWGHGSGDAEENPDHDELEWDEDELHEAKKYSKDLKKGKNKVEKDHKTIQEVVAASHHKSKVSPKKADKKPKPTEISAKEAAALKKAREKTQEAEKLKAAATLAKKKIKELEAAAAASKKAKEVERQKTEIKPETSASASKDIKQLEKAKTDTTEIVTSAAMKPKNSQNNVENFQVSPKHQTEPSEGKMNVDGLPINALGQTTTKTAEEIKINPTPVPYSEKDNPLPIPVEFTQHAPTIQENDQKQNLNPEVISHNQKLLDSGQALSPLVNQHQIHLQSMEIVGTNDHQEAQYHQNFQDGLMNDRNKPTMGTQNNAHFDNINRFSNEGHHPGNTFALAAHSFRSGGEKSTDISPGEHEQRETEPSLPKQSEPVNKIHESFLHSFPGSREDESSSLHSSSSHNMNSNRDIEISKGHDIKSFSSFDDHGNVKEKEQIDHIGNSNNFQDNTNSQFSKTLNEDIHSNIDIHGFNNPHNSNGILNSIKMHSNNGVKSNKELQSSNEIQIDNNRIETNNHSNKIESNIQGSSHSREFPAYHENRGDSEFFRGYDSPDDNSIHEKTNSNVNSHNNLEVHNRDEQNYNDHNDVSHGHEDGISHELGSSGVSRQDNSKYVPPGNPQPSDAQVQQQIPEEHHGMLISEYNKKIHSSDEASQTKDSNENKQKELSSLNNVRESDNIRDSNSFHNSASLYPNSKEESTVLHQSLKDDALIVLKEGANSETPYKEEEGLSASSDPILQKIREELKSGGNDIGGSSNSNKNNNNKDNTNSNNNGENMNSVNLVNNVLSDQNKDITSNLGNIHSAHPGAGTMQDLESLMSGTEQKEMVHKHSKCIECHDIHVNAKTRGELNNYSKPDYDLIFVKAPNPHSIKKHFLKSYLRKR